MYDQILIVSINILFGLITLYAISLAVGIYVMLKIPRSVNFSEWEDHKAQDFIQQKAMEKKTRLKDMGIAENLYDITDI